jgi:hypothetical protein
MWATFFYEANISFNIMWHLMFIEAVKATFESRTYYKPLSYHGLCIDLLKQSKVDVSKHVIEKMQNSIHKYEITICYDGWDNVAWHPLLNVMFACSSGNVFIGSIDTNAEQKDAHYICNALGGYIETIKPSQQHCIIFCKHWSWEV